MLLKVENLYKNFGKNQVLENINIELKENEIIAIVGPSGSGKSTLLRCINMIEKPTKGNIIFNNNDITKNNIDLNKYRQEVGMVFQQFNLFPHLTVLENITLVPIKLKLIEENEALKKAKNLLKDIGLLQKKDKYPDQLSGGEQQRVAIIRALMMEPKILLFDEPTSSLDPQMTREVLELIKEIAGKGMNMIIVSHELNFVKEISTKIIFLKDRKIIFNDKKDLFFSDKAPKQVKEFLIRSK